MKKLTAVALVVLAFTTQAASAVELKLGHFAAEGSPNAFAGG